MPESYIERLKVKRNVCSISWNIPLVDNVINTLPQCRNNSHEHKKVHDDIISQLNTNADPRLVGTSLAYDYVGSNTIMNSRMKRSLICHRADELLFPEQMEATLYAAAQGCVIVSAFVSTNERLVRNILIEQQLPFIHVLSYGMPLGYTPRGQAYDAVINALMAQATPWSNLTARQERTSRQQFMVGNAFVRALSWCDDDWWTQ